MPKDTDLMRDTGGKYKGKPGKKPSRTDRRTRPELGRDPDFKDTKRDPDLKKACRFVGIELMKIARELW